MQILDSISLCIDRGEDEQVSTRYLMIDRGESEEMKKSGETLFFV
jgi:hypothetical protein